MRYFLLIVALFLFITPCMGDTLQLSPCKEKNIIDIRPIQMTFSADKILLWFVKYDIDCDGKCDVGVVFKNVHKLPDGSIAYEVSPPISCEVLDAMYKEIEQSCSL